MQVKADKVGMVRKYIGKALEMNSWGKFEISVTNLYGSSRPDGAGTEKVVSNAVGALSQLIPFEAGRVVVKFYY